MSLVNLLDRVWKIELVRAVLILIAILHVCFSPCIWGNRTLLESAQDVPSILPGGAWSGPVEPRLTFWKVLDPGAPGWQTEPMLALMRHEYIREHTTPLWNPYQAFGTPVLAGMQAQPLFPLILPLIGALNPKTYSLFLLLRLLIAGLGAFAYLRFFISFYAALCGSIATMLGGYYILFISMPHLSVEMWLPVALFAGEYLLRRSSYGSFVALSAVVFLMIIGGMPESTALLLTAVYCYLLYRIITAEELRARWKSLVLSIGLAAVTGITLSACMLLPAFEFLRNSFNAHEPRHMGGLITGRMHDPLNSAILTYLFPLLFGPPITDIFPQIYSGLRNYFGIIPLFLCCAACACLRVRRAADRDLNLITSFFLATAVLIVLKRFGFWPVDILGSLPVFSLILFPKYDEALLSVSVAIVCGAAIEYLLRARWSKLTVIVSLALAFASIPIGVVISIRVLVRAIRAQHVGIQYLLVALGVPVVLLFTLALVLLFLNGPWSDQYRRYIATTLVILVAIEFCFNFVVPVYRIFSGFPYATRDPFTGAPFVRFLQSKTVEQERIFARDLVLHPVWASAFQLSDIRDLDAVYYRKYFPFLHAFLGKPSGIRDVELGDRVRGDGDYSFETARKRRLLQLSSVKYIPTLRSLDAAKEQQAPTFKPIYNAEVKIFEFDDILPRAALYSRVELVSGENQVLKRLADPSLDIFTSAVLDSSALSANQKAALSTINSTGEPARVRAATIRKYLSRDVEIEAETDRPSLLVLNDSDYPGWSAEVDGNKADIVPANYMFRGIILQPGRHSVRFTYNPASFRVGVGISMFAVVVLIAGWLVAHWRKRNVGQIFQVHAGSEVAT